MRSYFRALITGQVQCACEKGLLAVWRTCPPSAQFMLRQAPVQLPPCPWTGISRSRHGLNRVNNCSSWRFRGMGMSQEARPWWYAVLSSHVTAISQMGIIYGPRSRFSFTAILLFYCHCHFIHYILYNLLLPLPTFQTVWTNIPPSVVITLRIIHYQPPPPTTSINMHSDKYLPEYNTLYVLMTQLNIPR